jgi:hypothetical protein
VLVHALDSLVRQSDAAKVTQGIRQDMAAVSKRMAAANKARGTRIAYAFRSFLPLPLLLCLFIYFFPYVWRLGDLTRACLGACAACIVAAAAASAPKSKDERVALRAAQKKEFASARREMKDLQKSLFEFEKKAVEEVIGGASTHACIRMHTCTHAQVHTHAHTCKHTRQRVAHTDARI